MKKEDFKEKLDEILDWIQPILDRYQDQPSRTSSGALAALTWMFLLLVLGVTWFVVHVFHALYPILAPLLIGSFLVSSFVMLFSWTRLTRFQKRRGSVCLITLCVFLLLWSTSRRILLDLWTNGAALGQSISATINWTSPIVLLILFLLVATGFFAWHISTEASRSIARGIALIQNRNILQGMRILEEYHAYEPMHQYLKHLLLKKRASSQEHNAAFFQQVAVSAEKAIDELHRTKIACQDSRNEALLGKTGVMANINQGLEEIFTICERMVRIRDMNIDLSRLGKEWDILKADETNLRGLQEQAKLARESIARLVALEAGLGSEAVDWTEAFSSFNSYVEQLSHISRPQSS